jgi:hypothetical protein
VSKSRQLRLVTLIAVAACGTESTALKPVIVDDVAITATVPGNCRAGASCDPLIAPYTTVGLVTVRNNGTATAYLRACGSSAELTEQQLVDGQWQDVRPGITCPVAPASVSLAAGDSIQTNWWFAPGTRRLTLGIARASDMSGETTAASESFVVH